MSNKYEDILSLVNKGNEMGLSNTIKRDYGIPLDFTSVQENYEKAIIYAATSTLAYVGQTISVGDKLYIVTEESQGKYPKEVSEGETQYDVYLSEVGTAPKADGKTIDVIDGILTLHNVDQLDETKEYYPQIHNGALLWSTDAPVSSTTEQKIAELQSLVGKPAEGDTPASGLFEDVSGLTGRVDNLQHYVEDVAININAAHLDIYAKLGDVKEGENLVQLIADAEARAKEAIPSNISEFTNDAGYLTEHQDISGKADKATTLSGYGITDAYTKDEVNNAISAMSHLNIEIVENMDFADSPVAGTLYLLPDEAAASGTYLEYLAFEKPDGSVVIEQIGSTAIDLTQYSTTSEVSDMISSQLENYAYNKQSIDSLLSDKVSVATYEDDYSAISREITNIYDVKVGTDELTNYYTKEELNSQLSLKADASDVTAALATKVETAQIRHTTEGVGEGVTKDGTALTITVDAYRKSEVYTKSETDNQIDAKIASVTGGESAADVKLALESYRDAVNTEIWGADASSWTTTTTIDGKTVVTYDPKYGSTSRIDTIESSLDNVSLTISDLQKDQETNKSAIDALTASINGVSPDDSSSLSYRIGALETANTTHITEFNNLKSDVQTVINTTIPGISSRIDEQETVIDELSEHVSTLNSTLSTKVDASAVYSKTEVDAYINTLQSEKADIDSVYTKSEVDNLLSNLDQSTLEEAIASNTTAIAILNGVTADSTGDSGKSVRAIAKEEVNAIVGSAPDALNTLEEIASWIQNDETGAAAISNKVAEHSSYLEGIGGENEPATVLAAISSAVRIATDTTLGSVLSAKDVVFGETTQPAENAVYVDPTTGLMTVKRITTDILFNGDEELVLNGGSATV